MKHIAQNISTGKTEQIDDSQLSDAVKSGNYLLADNDYQVVDPKTNYTKTVKTKDLGKILSSGFIPVDDNFRHEQDMQQKYGDETIKALVLGGARGLSFGLSDVALERMGLSEEMLREVKNRNEIASITGELGGAIAPVILSGGTSAVAEGAVVGARGASLAARIASAAPTAGLAKLTSKLGAAVGEALPETAPALIKSLTTHGVGAASEGAVYGLGNAISESAIGNKEFNAESVMDDVTAGAEFGGILGLGGTFLASGLKKMGRKFAKAGIKDSPMPPEQKAVELKNLDTIDELEARAEKYKDQLTSWDIENESTFFQPDSRNFTSFGR